MYACEMWGLIPGVDGVAKYWTGSAGEASNSILKWFGLSIVWVNGLALYALQNGFDAVAIQKVRRAGFERACCRPPAQCR